MYLNESKLENAAIIVIGDVMLDIYNFCFTENSRPSPEKASTLVYRVDDEKSFMKLGGAGNVAANACCFVSPVFCLGVYGNKTFDKYESLCTLFIQNNIQHCLVRDHRRTTTVKRRLYIDNEYRMRQDHESTIPISTEITYALLDILDQKLEEFTKRDFNVAVIFSDYTKGCLHSKNIHLFLQKCKQYGILTLADFKPINADYFNGTSIISLNEHELRQLFPHLGDGLTLVDTMQMALDTVFTESRYLVVTRGEEGIIGLDRKENEGYIVPGGPKIENPDPVGCGDTVRAVLTAGMLSGLSFGESLWNAHAAGRAVVQKIGTATTNFIEVHRELDMLYDKGD